jgi:YbbR domain-containing protein
MVTVVLPAAHVDDVVRIDTEDLSLSGARSTFTRDLRLVVPEGVNLMGDSEVRVTVEIRPAASPADDASSRERESETQPQG